MLLQPEKIGWICIWGCLHPLHGCFMMKECPRFFKVIHCLMVEMKPECPELIRLMCETNDDVRTILLVLISDQLMPYLSNLPITTAEHFQN